MSLQLMIVGKAGPLIDACVKALREADADLVCRHAPWDVLGVPPGPRPPDLALAAAAELDPCAIDFACNGLRPPLLLALPEGAPSTLVELAARVADDFVMAPIRADELHHRASRLLNAHNPAERSLAGQTDGFGDGRAPQGTAMAGLLGHDGGFLATLAKIPLAARSNGPVLVVGETGTGKELCARALHNAGPRAGRPFVPADCASLPDHLFENEMFGHVSGAYTDARRDQKGLVAMAEGGTLFLDEINSLSLHAQAKLLRLLQERIYRPLGGNSFVPANVSIVAATNGDLQELVRQGQFRADLFFRLNAVQLSMPPLRERRGDIALLARHFVALLCAEAGLPRKTLTVAALRTLSRHDWPGNVRELHNTLQGAVLFSPGTHILPSDLAAGPSASGSAVADDPANFRMARSHAVASFERRYVEDLMRACEGNVSGAARLAGKERRAFGRLVKRYEIPRQ